MPYADVPGDDAAAPVTTPVQTPPSQSQMKGGYTDLPAGGYVDIPGGTPTPPTQKPSPVTVAPPKQTNPVVNAHNASGTIQGALDTFKATNLVPPQTRPALAATTNVPGEENPLATVGQNVIRSIQPAYKATSKDVDSLLGKLHDELDYAAHHSVQAFQNVEQGAMRGVLTVVNRGQSHIAADKVTDEPVAEGRALIETVGDYLLHPANWAKLGENIVDPKKSQILTDTFEHYLAGPTGVPVQGSWQRAAMDTAVQAFFDPASYVPLDEVFKTLQAGFKVASGAHAGAAVLHAAGSLLQGTTGLPGGSELGNMLQRIASDHGATIGKLQTQTKDIFDKLFQTRHDLNEWFNSNQGKLIRMGIENAGTHLEAGLQRQMEQLLKDNKDVLTSKKAFEELPGPVQQFRNKIMYMFGSQQDRAFAMRRGYKPTGDEFKMNDGKPYNIMDFEAPKGSMPKGSKIPEAMTKRLPYANPIEKKGIGPILKQPVLEVKHNANVGEFGPKFHADQPGLAPRQYVNKAGVMKVRTSKNFLKAAGRSQYDALSDYFLRARTNIRTGMIAHKTAQLYEDRPDLFTGKFPAAPEALPEFFAAKIGNRQPHVELGGTLGNAYEMSVHKISQLWKESLLANVLPHGLRNVGVVTALWGGVPTAAKALKYFVSSDSAKLFAQHVTDGTWASHVMNPDSWQSGIPKDLMTRLEASGGAQHFWRNTPRMLQWMGAPGKGADAFFHTTAKIMDNFENAYRASYLELQDKLMGPSKTEWDEYAKGAKVSNDIGGYQHTNAIAKLAQGIGGTFVLYRLGTVPRAYLNALMHRTGLVTNATQAETNFSQMLPHNKGIANPVNYNDRFALGGPLEEGPALGGSVGALVWDATVGLASGGRANIKPSFFTSPSTLGPVMGNVGNAFNEQEPYKGETMAQDIARTGTSMVPGGGLAQQTVPYLNMFPDQSGLPYWMAEMYALTGGYVEHTNKKAEKARKAAWRKMEAR